MKLRNKKTGEIGELQITEKHCAVVVGNGTADCNVKLYCTLDKLNEEWEDYEEPRTFFTIYYDGTISEFEDGDDDQIRDMKAIGNYFETKEEAEKGVEKLKAWKRLKDKGAKIIDYGCYGGTDTKGEFLGEIKVTIDAPHEIDKYLFDLLFGGEA